jgi:hypothetical protein
MRPPRQNFHVANPQFGEKKWGGIKTWKIENEVFGFLKMRKMGEKKKPIIEDHFLLLRLLLLLSSSSSVFFFPAPNPSRSDRF